MRYAEQQKDPTSRIAGLVFVVILHIGLVYALLNGLGSAAIEVLKKPLETKLIDEIKPPDTPPPPPPPKLAPPPPPFIPLPDINVRAVSSANAITAVTNVKPVEAPPPPVAKREPVVVQPEIDAGRNCRQPEYPAVSRRMEETGTVVLQFLVELDGKVVESKVESSSGHPRLDEAARDALSLCKFKPGSVDGRPDRMWGRLRYTWKLN